MNNLLQGVILLSHTWIVESKLVSVWKFYVLSLWDSKVWKRASGYVSSTDHVSKQVKTNFVKNLTCEKYAEKRSHTCFHSLNVVSTQPKGNR